MSKGKQRLEDPVPNGSVKALATSALDTDVQRVVDQTIAIQKLMQILLREGEHYGVVPGTEKTDSQGNDISKPALFQAGADKLCLLFRLRPEYEETSIERDDLIHVKMRCRLYHIPTGELWGEGMGSANSRESKYANQATARVCPNCNKAAIAKGSSAYGGGWYCNRKKDGCGSNFSEKDPQIVGQPGHVDTQRIYDMHNTILKMSCKRSRVAAVLTATAASDFFTQDLDDLLREDDDDVLPKGEAPAARTAQGNGNGTGSKRANPIQVRDLNLALAEAGIGFDAGKDLRGTEKQDAVNAARVRWANALLPEGRQVKGLNELTGPEADQLVKIATEGGGAQGSNG